MKYYIQYVEKKLEITEQKLNKQQDDLFTLMTTVSNNIEYVILYKINSKLNKTSKISIESYVLSKVKYFLLELDNKVFIQKYVIPSYILGFKNIVDKFKEIEKKILDDIQTYNKINDSKN